MKKIAGEGEESLYQTKQIGTPYFIGPSNQFQVSPQEQEKNNDFWALGVIVYSLLEGRVPFDGDNKPKL